MGGGGVPAGDSAGGMTGQARFNRVDTNDINYRIRGVISLDVRQQTEYGTLRTYFRFGAENTTPQRPRRRHHRQPVLGPRVHPVRGLHGRQVTVVLRPLHLRRRLQLPQRARLRRHRRLGPEPLGLYRPVRQRLLRHALARRPREPQGHRAPSTCRPTASCSRPPRSSPTTRSRKTLSATRCDRHSASGCRTSSPTCGSIRPGASPASAPPCMMPAAATTNDLAVNA